MQRWTDPPKWLEWPAVLFLRNPYVQMRLGVIATAFTLAIWAPLRFWLHGQGMNAAEEVIYHLSMLAVLWSSVTLVAVTDVGETVK